VIIAEVVNINFLMNCIHYTYIFHNEYCEEHDADAFVPNARCFSRHTGTKTSFSGSDRKIDVFLICENSYFLGLEK